MFALVVVVALFAAPPLDALQCKTRKCTVSKEKWVWKVTLPNVKEVDGSTCREPAEEWWYVGADGAGQLLLSVCNDGYGASGVGEDTITVDDTTFKHSRNGGSAWRWNSDTVVGRDPLRVISQQSLSYNTMTPNFGTATSWNADTFSGDASADVAPCNEQGEPNPEGDAVKFTANLVPSVQVPAAFLSGGWKTASLGTCSAAASFVTFGKQAGAKDASLHAMVSGTELFVEVRDDVFVETAAKWTLADHVELWLADDSDPWAACATRKGGQQWGFALDGAVNAGFGSPKPLKVEVAKSEGVVRMHVRLPGPAKQITVVYSDTDDGKKQKALLATSELKFAAVSSFGLTRDVQPNDAVCEVVGGALTPKRTRTFEPKTAVIQ